MGRSHSLQYQLNSLESISPAAITVLETIQTLKQSLSNQYSSLSHSHVYKI